MSLHKPACLGPLALTLGLLSFPTSLSAAPQQPQQRSDASALELGSARMERALDSIQIPHLKGDLFFLASDEMAGRDSPSPEQRLAARFIRARLQRLGLEPGAGDSYLYGYQLGWRALDAERSNGALTGELGGKAVEVTWHPGADYLFPSERGANDQSIAGPLVWVGAGTKDDLSGLDLEGCWAVSPLSLEQLSSQEGRARLERSLTSRGNTARVKKAAGLLLLCDESVPDALLDERLLPNLDRLKQGRVSPPGRPESDSRNSEFPTLVLRAAAGRTLRSLADFPAEGQPELGARLGLNFKETRVRALNAVGEATVELEDVCGFWPGSDPKLADEVIVVSAHYDHVGRFGKEIWNGADDNGSGTTGMLSVAEALTVYGPLKRSVLFIWVSAEEKGLFGSQAWCQNPILPEGKRIVANLNMDMIGRNAPDDLMMTPTKAMGDIYNGLARVAEKNGPLEGFPKFRSADEYYGRSDQISFQKAFNIPVLFLFADVHEDYHQPTDTPDKIDFDKVRRVSRLITRMLLDLQEPELRL